MLAALLLAASLHAAPLPQHQALSALAGTWDLTFPGSTNTGRAEFSWVLDGHFLQQRFDAKFGDKPFAGLGYMGYDERKGLYVSSWLDSYSREIMTREGKDFRTARGKNEGKPVEETWTFEGPDKVTFRLFTLRKNGSRKKDLEIVYTRAK